MSLSLYYFGDEEVRSARVHYHYWRAPNKRPLCKLSALNPYLRPMIVTNDRGLVTCGNCLRALDGEESDSG